jgi:hypothetical protein
MQQPERPGNPAAARVPSYKTAMLASVSLKILE